MAQKTTASQTNFGFTNMGSNIFGFRNTSIWNKKFRFGSPCIRDNKKANKNHSLIVSVKAYIFSYQLFLILSRGTLVELRYLQILLTQASSAWHYYPHVVRVVFMADQKMKSLFWIFEETSKNVLKRFFRVVTWKN